jgi:RHH-type rel operon transcriptional repressor/antitoxin RelB
MATSIRLAPETEQRLDRLASNTGRTKAYYLREMIEKGLEDMEDLYDAEQATLARREGRSQSISQQQMEKLLGLGD